MTLTELQNEVVTATNRPDLINTKILSAIKAATLKVHQMDFYGKDLFETILTFPSAEFLQSFDYLLTIPRWRALKYLRKIDPISGDPMEPPLKVLTPEALLDDYNVEKVNVVYEAGMFLQIKMDAEIASFVLGCYVNPDITTGTYTSWIAQMYPYAIVFEAASQVFKTVGKDDEQASMKLLAAEQAALVKINNIQAVGY